MSHEQQLHGGGGASDGGSAPRQGVVAGRAGIVDDLGLESARSFIAHSLEEAREADVLLHVIDALIRDAKMRRMYGDASGA